MTKIIVKKERKEMPTLLPPGAMKEIAKVCRCGQKTVYNALRKNYRGAVSDNVRSYVLEKYGTAVKNDDSNE